MRKPISFLIGSGVFVCGIVHAEVPTACSSLKTAAEVVACALLNHPDLRRAQAKVEQGQARRERAAQFINPELSGKWGAGESQGDSNKVAEVGLSHTFELGGKRGARIDVAEAEARLPQAEAEKARETVFAETVKHLYRLRQIRDEQRTIDEILGTFRQVSGQYRKRPTLSPEQEVASGVFSFAESDYLIKQAQLKTEWTRIIQRLETATAGAIDERLLVLPPRQTNWPKHPEVKENSDLRGAELAISAAEVEISRREYDLAKAESYPDLKAGPFYTYENQGGVTSNAVGISVSLPLPILSLNGGSKQVALKGMAVAETNRALRQQELRSELEALLRSYGQITAVLSSQPTSQEIEKKHKETEALFSRGIVSSSLLIEAHRQLYDLLKGQNEYEIEALDSLIRISILKGQPLESIL